MQAARTPATPRPPRSEEHDPTAHFGRRGVGRGRVWVGHADPPFWVVVTLVATKRERIGSTPGLVIAYDPIHVHGRPVVWGAAYERFMGRWSRHVAGEFVDWLDIPAGLRWLDIGCGTGALTAAVLSQADPVSILGTDPSEAFVATAARQVDGPRAQFVVADAGATPSGRVDVVVAGLL